MVQLIIFHDRLIVLCLLEHINDLFETLVIISFLDLQDINVIGYLLKSGNAVLVGHFSVNITLFYKLSLRFTHLHRISHSLLVHLGLQTLNRAIGNS